MLDKPISVIVFKPSSRTVYLAQWTDAATGKKRTKSTGTPNKRDAERFAGKLQDQLNAGEAITTARTTWETFRKRVERDFLPAKRPTTRKRYKAAMDAVERHLRPKLLTGITAEAVTEFAAKLRANGSRKKRTKGNAEATVAAQLRHLKALLRWGARHGMLRTVPHIEIGTSEAPARGRPITGEEFDRMLEAVPKVTSDERAPSWCYLLRGLYLGGLRIGEACRLTWDDPEGIRVELDREFPLLFIPGRLQKGRKDTVTPIVPEFAALLRETPLAARTGFVFNPAPKRKGVDRLGQQVVERVVREIGEKAGVVTKRSPVEFASAHDLRRSFCHRWAQKILPQHLRVLARHRSVATTLAYYSEADAGQTAAAVHEAVARIANEIADTPSEATESGPTKTPQAPR